MPGMTVQEFYDYEQYIDIKFVPSIDLSTLVISNFVLTNLDAASPGTVSGAFSEIDITKDYNTISRILRLYYTSAILPETDYRLTFSNLKNLSGTVLATDYIEFTTAATVSVATIPPTVITIEDESIVNVDNIIFDPTLTTSGDNLYIVSIKPDHKIAFYLDGSYNEGRIEIIFNEPIAANYVSSEFFKVQRKLYGGSGVSRWEDVSVLVTSEPLLKIVFVYLPSNDATPLYGEPDLEYYESGYKYRLRISSKIGI